MCCGFIWIMLQYLSLRYDKLYMRTAALDYTQYYSPTRYRIYYFVLAFHLFQFMWQNVETLLEDVIISCGLFWKFNLKNYTHYENQSLFIYNYTGAYYNFEKFFDTKWLASWFFSLANIGLKFKCCGERYTDEIMIP